MADPSTSSHQPADLENAHEEIASLGAPIFAIDLDDLGAEALEQRLELTLAVVLEGLEPQQDQGCAVFSCSQYEMSA